MQGLLETRQAAWQQHLEADRSTAQQTMATLRRASQDERLEYERLLQAALDHRSTDEALLQQRLAAAQGENSSATCATQI